MYFASFFFGEANRSITISLFFSLRSVHPPPRLPPSHHHAATICISVKCRMHKITQCANTECEHSRTPVQALALFSCTHARLFLVSHFQLMQYATSDWSSDSFWCCRVHFFSPLSLSVCVCLALSPATLFTPKARQHAPKIYTYVWTK